MHDDNDILRTVFWVAVFAIFMVWAITDCQAENRRQAEIKRECTLVRKVAGHMVIGTSISGKSDLMIGGTSDQRCYRCPNGIEECF